MQSVRQASDNQLFLVGEGVNAISPTQPYLAGYITRNDGDDIYVNCFMQFQGSQTGDA